MLNFSSGFFCTIKRTERYFPFLCGETCFILQVKPFLFSPCDLFCSTKIWFQIAISHKVFLFLFRIGLVLNILCFGLEIIFLEDLLPSFKANAHIRISSDWLN